MLQWIIDQYIQCTPAFQKKRSIVWLIPTLIGVGNARQAETLENNMLFLYIYSRQDDFNKVSESLEKLWILFSQ